MAKRKKEKITYIDDGRTIADMSGIQPSMGIHPRHPARYRAGFKEQWKTYWTAVKLMFLPMLAVVGGLCVIFAIAWLVFSVI